MLHLKQRAGEVAMLAVDVAGVLFAGSGAAVVAFFGKFAASLVLAVIALGFFLRFASRKGLPQAAPPRPRASSRVLSALIAGVLVAALVEAADFPVRFSQPGFEPWHWVLVAVALWVAYSASMRLIAAKL